MKKNLIIVVSIFFVLIIFLLVIKLAPMGSKKVFMGASLIELEVPKMSIVESECCTYSVTFKTLRGAKIVQKELEDIINKYEKITCNDSVYYYDSSKNITIENYSIEEGFLFSKFKIDYQRGNICEF